MQNRRADLRDSELLVAEVMTCESPESNLTAPLLFELARFGIGLPIITYSQNVRTAVNTSVPGRNLIRHEALQQEEILLD